MSSTAAAASADGVAIHILTKGLDPKTLAKPRKREETVGAFVHYMQKQWIAPTPVAAAAGPSDTNGGAVASSAAGGGGGASATRRVFMFVTTPAPGGSNTYFIPSPDQTLGELALMYGETPSKLTVTFAEKVFFG